MKLWIIKPVSIRPYKNDPWKPWYDKAFGFVVRAETELNARLIADQEAGDENRGDFHPWLHPQFSTCLELSPDGDEEEIIRDFAAA